MTKTLEQLRRSEYHQQLGQKMCAAFIAQQQGITLNTALRRIHLPVGDLWLMIAEYAREAYARNIEPEVLRDDGSRLRGPIMWAEPDMAEAAQTSATRGCDAHSYERKS